MVSAERVEAERAAVETVPVPVPVAAVPVAAAIKAAATEAASMVGAATVAVARAAAATGAAVRWQRSEWQGRGWPRRRRGRQGRQAARVRPAGVLVPLGDLARVELKLLGELVRAHALGLGVGSDRDGHEVLAAPARGAPLLAARRCWQPLAVRAVLLADELVLHRLADGAAELAGLVLARLVLGGDALGLLLVLVDLHEQLRAGGGRAAVGRRLGVIRGGAGGEGEGACGCGLERISEGTAPPTCWSSVSAASHLVPSVPASAGSFCSIPAVQRCLYFLIWRSTHWMMACSSFGQAKFLNASDVLIRARIVFHSSFLLYWCSVLPLTFAWRVSQALVPEKLICRSMIKSRLWTSHFICFSVVAAGSTSVGSTSMGSCRQRGGGRAVR